MRLVHAVLALFLLSLTAVGALADEGTKVREYEEYGIIAEKGGILIGRGAFIVEPGFQYTHLESQRLDITGFSVLPALVIGMIQVEKVKRDIFVPSLSLKYGILDSLEFDVKIPYSFRQNEYTLGQEDSTVNTDVSSSGIGDIEGALFFQLLRERAGIPDVLLNVRVKSDTGKSPFDIETETIDGVPVPVSELPQGSGFWAVEPSFTLVKSSDPAAVFFNAGYFWHIKRDIDGVGEVDPSDSINFSIGAAYALNEKFSLSTTYEQKLFTEAEVEGETLPETDINVASLIFGGSYILGDRTSFSVTVSIGLTPEAPDVQLTFRMPIFILK